MVDFDVIRIGSPRYAQLCYKASTCLHERPLADAL